MKKISMYTLSVLFLAVGMASCTKSTKGKITNEWKVTSYDDVQTYTNINGTKTTSTISMTETVITNTDVTEPTTGPSTTNTQSGTVNKNEFTIKKDGTWTWVIDAVYTTGNSLDNQILEQSGTWSFVGKTKGDDFKKNERVLFNVLNLKATETETVNQVVVDSSTDNVTYATGNNTMIYTISESKKDKLELELESKYVFTQSSYMNSSLTSRKITLEKKD
jgi:hypothetical protein